ncbi:hypothetical protein B7P43_G09230 [Cryptotermes secundus]|uniref:ATPase AAA-type core domain-containing protein n=1 Tax=Cryptotermes secundus TaxID=105785 RepID=A0A2J7QGR9_9NEOP|nr:hypothetical protein B7P43_G09230 [Cryptotermes secundus]
MKAITYYLQFPAGEKEDKDQNGNGRLPVLNGDSDEAGAQKIHKGLFKTASVVEKSSCPSLFSSEIKNSPSFVRTSTRRVRSKCKIQFKMTSDADNSNESVELDRHSIILQDKEDVSISQTTSIKTSVKELHDETGSLQTVSVGKQNLKKKKKLSLSSQKVSNCDTTNKSLCVKSEVLNEIFVESSRKTEDSLLFQGNGKSSLFVKCKLKDSLKEPKQHGFGTDVTNETCTDDKTSDKIPSRLNESNNAFHILMSSRIWQSPHEQGPDETKDHTYSNRKKTIVIADAPKKTVEIKENRKKRKKKLDVVRKRRIKKAKLSDTSSEIEIGAEKKPVVRSKKVVIVPESDSDGEGNTALGQSIDTLKSKAEDKQDHRGCGKMVVEETDDDYAEQSDEKELMKKDDKVVNQDSLMNSKLSTRTSRKMDGSKSRLSHKTSSKHILEEIKDNCSEPEQDHLHLKKLVVKVEKISPEKLIQISTQKCYEGSEKKVRKGRGKLVVGGKGTKEKGSEREDRMVNCQLSIHKAKMSPKLPKSTKKFVIQCNKSTGKSFFERRVKLVKKSEQESGEFGKKKSETWIEDTDSEEENQKQTEMNKKDKTNKAASVSTIDSNCEIPADPKKHIPFPEETKKRNSLFSYFNKVSKDEVLLKPEKIKVEVQIHSPPSSPSVKQRRTSVPEDKRKQIHCVKSKVLDMEDQIIVLESHITKPATDASSVFVVTPKKHNEINDMKTPPSGSGWKMRVRLRESPAQPVLDDTGDSSDDNIFIPKRKWVESKIPAQPIDAGEALQASRTGEKCMNSEGMESQDNDACVEGAEGEMEVIICSNPDRKPNDMKLAPLFLRKPKTDPAVVEARRNFLKSGVPDSVKKLADIQRSLEGQYQFLFPTVAHVQQQEDQLCVWNLPLVELPLNTTETEPPTLTLKQIEAVELGTFSNCCSTDPACSFTKPSTPTPITCFQKLLRILKSESPDFPIYRAFRRLHSKYLQGVEKSTEEVLGKDIKQQKRRGGKSRVTRSNAHIERQKEEICNRKSEVMWTEKYKPTSVDDLVGNRHSIDQLKHWLESWKHYSDEIQHRDKESGRNRKDSSSGDEFFDCDSNDNINRNLPNNTAILVGPHGCGKTSAVYAIANELGCKVLEINTSSKRNGKRILSELQEATQSHQVKSCSEHASGALGSFVKAKPTNSRKVKSSRYSSIVK